MQGVKSNLTLRTDDRVKKKAKKKFGSHFDVAFVLVSKKFQRGVSNPISK